MTLRISLLLLAYNQAQVVEAAVRSCLAQEGEPLEIVLSDDASTDATYSVLCDLASAYQGPHQVRVRRNPVNLGIGEHYNQAIANSSGKLLVTAAGDDISLPHRVQTLAAAWDANGQTAELIASHVIDMSSDGICGDVIRVDDLSRWSSAQDWTRKRPHVIGASHAFTRRMHERFGSFSKDLSYEDQVMALRACCMGGGITVDEPLVQYRRGGVSAGAAKQLGASQYLISQERKHVKQLALFAQVNRDLICAGLAQLWRGKVKRYHSRSQLALQMLEAQDTWSRLTLPFQIPGAGWYWSCRHALKYEWCARKARASEPTS